MNEKEDFEKNFRGRSVLLEGGFRGIIVGYKSPRLLIVSVEDSSNACYLRYKVPTSKVVGIEEHFPKES